MKTADELLAERKPIEEKLAAWLREWDALCADQGWSDNGHLRPIEEVLREQNAAR